MNSDTCQELKNNPPTPFPSIAPLSERIRKKTTTETTSTLKSHLEIEAAIIESSIIEDQEPNKICEEKVLMSTALREFFETKLEEVEEDKDNNKLILPPSPVPVSEPDNPVAEIEDEMPAVKVVEMAVMEVNEAKEMEIKKPLKDPRLKDPRTVTPNDQLAPSTKAETPIKRKVC